MRDKFKYQFTQYYWMVPNPTTGKMRKTRYRMTEAEALRYPGAVKIEADSETITGSFKQHGSPRQWH